MRISARKRLCPHAAGVPNVVEKGTKLAAKPLFQGKPAAKAKGKRAKGAAPKARARFTRKHARACACVLLPRGFCKTNRATLKNPSRNEPRAPCVQIDTDTAYHVRCACLRFGTPRQAGANLKRKCLDKSDEGSRTRKRGCTRTDDAEGNVFWGPHNLTDLELPDEMLPLPNQRGGADSYVMKSVNGAKIQAPPK